GQARIKAAVCRDTITHSAGASRVGTPGNPLVLSLNVPQPAPGASESGYHLAHRLPTALSPTPPRPRLNPPRRFTPRRYGVYAQEIGDFISADASDAAGDTCLSKGGYPMKRALIAIASVGILVTIVGVDAANAQEGPAPNPGWEWYATVGPVRRGNQCV